MFFFNLIYSAFSKPVRYCNHLYRERAYPLQVNQASDILFLVDKDIALMEIGKLEDKRSVTPFAVDIVM